MGTVPVVEFDQLRPETWIYNFGHNIVGRTKLKVIDTPGTVLTFRFVENWFPVGELGFSSSVIRVTKVIHLKSNLKEIKPEVVQDN